jgi:hypothetical protein
VAARESGLGEQNKSVKRVAVFAEGVRKKAVIEWILRSREECAVKPNGASVMVHFVFIARTLRDFNDHFNFHRCHFMPWGCHRDKKVLAT